MRIHPASLALLALLPLAPRAAAAQDLSAEEQRRFTDAKERMAYYYDKIGASCGPTLKIEFDVASFKTAQAPLPWYDDITNACQAGLETLANACERPETKARVNRKVKVLRCQRVFGKDQNAKNSDDLEWDRHVGFVLDAKTGVLTNRVWIKSRNDAEISTTKSFDRDQGLRWIDQHL